MMKHYLSSYSKKRQYLLFGGDLFVLLLAIFVSYAIRIFINAHELSFEQLATKFSPWLILVVLPHLMSLYLLDLYNLNRLILRFRSSVMVVFSVGLAGLIIGSIFFFLPKYVFGRQVLLIHLIISSFFLVGWRITFYELVSINETAKRLAFIGSIKNFVVFGRTLSEIDKKSLKINCAYFIPGPESESSLQPDGVTVYTSLKQLLNSRNFDILVFDVLGKKFGDEEIRSIMEEKYKKKGVFDIPSFITSLSGRIPLDLIDGYWLLSREGLQGYVSRPYVRVKRLLDIIGSSLLLLVFFPILILLGIALKIDSRGPVIFSQQRIGRNRRAFNCLKFRTMVKDAELVSGPTWSSEDDPRITRMGKMLRKSRLDELPQLWNVLKGDISFIGPRPIRKHFADQLSMVIPFYELRFSVQPGLSGWAQVNHDYAGSVEGQKQKFEYELFYIQNMSIFLDILTVVKTVKSVFSLQGK
ncbi:MAG TPA: exopolysaccharide biosynthesis polyprenyl glycosylphosphotransferase [Gammaproteobacteria bacterium]|nr:exopolysaccharide biosynthesis polyprenyl glycosylphosphotransferase [Gammaproteobacteria bacterium]